MILPGHEPLTAVSAGAERPCVARLEEKSSEAFGVGVGVWFMFKGFRGLVFRFLR